MRYKDIIIALTIAFITTAICVYFIPDALERVMATLIIAAICIVYLIIKAREKMEERKTEAWLEARAELYRQQNAANIRFKNWYDNYISTHGLPDKKIILRENDINGLILVNEAAQKVYINGITLDFNDILNYSVTDNPITIKGDSQEIVESDDSSMLKRAIIGHIFAGDAGAIIGGLTARTTTTYHEEDDIIEHNYTILININSISNPIMKIAVGSDTELANEIAGLLNVIISR